MKEVTKKEVAMLLLNGIIFNSTKGYVDGRGYPVGYYRTRNKRYIEDKYADMATKMT